MIKTVKKGRKVMRTIQYQEIINNIKEMCIEANHFLCYL